MLPESGSLLPARSVSDGGRLGRRSRSGLVDGGADAAPTQRPPHTAFPFSVTLLIPVACPASSRVLNPNSIEVPPAIRAFQKPGMLLIVYFVPTWLTSWAFHTVVIS